MQQQLGDGLSMSQLGNVYVIVQTVRVQGLSWVLSSQTILVQGQIDLYGRRSGSTRMTGKPLLTYFTHMTLAITKPKFQCISRFNINRN